GRLDEVRSPAARAALGDLPGCAAPALGTALRARVRRGDARGFLPPAARAEPAPCRARLLRPDDPQPGRAAVAVLALGLAPVPRGPTRPARATARAPGRARRGGGRPAVLAAAKVA